MTGLERLRKEVEAVEWWHDIDLGNGIITPGRGGSRRRLERMRMPADLSGRTVLDLGTWDGLFAFEAERRGARRVVALDDWQHPGFRIAHRALGSRVEFVAMDVRAMSSANVGVFDLVIFMGVLYHLPDPLRGLERVAAVTGDQLILETESSLAWVDRPAAEFRAAGLAPEQTIGDWWIPNAACVEALLGCVGFSRTERVFPPPGPPAARWRRLLRRTFPGRFGPPSNRLFVHAWKSA